MCQLKSATGIDCMNCRNTEKEEREEEETRKEKKERKQRKQKMEEDTDGVWETVRKGGVIPSVSAAEFAKTFYVLVFTSFACSAL